MKYVKSKDLKINLLLLIGLLLIIGKLLLIIFNSNIVVRYSPFDDTMYVSRAYEFLNGNSWGHYNEYILSKLPGISLWLIAGNKIGISYLLGINLIYIIIGFILIFINYDKEGINYKIKLFIFGLYLFNPITLSIGWNLVMREALSSVLTIALIALSYCLLDQNKIINKNYIILGFASIFAFVQILREEDKLYWIYLFLLIIGMMYLNKSKLNRITLIIVIKLIFATVALTTTINFSLRIYNEVNYGLPILNDYSEGEFPKLLSVIRGIESKVDNRLVMVPNEVIEKLKVLIPEFKPVLERLPEPGLHTYSCKLHNVCSEWSNGWMPWWIKKAIVESSEAVTLTASQSYMLMIRLKIESLCSEETLKCNLDGGGLIPPFELRWSRAFLNEFLDLIKFLRYPTNENSLYTTNNNDSNIKLITMYGSVTGNKYIQDISDEKKIQLENKVTESKKLLIPIFSFLYILIIFFGTVALFIRIAVYPGIKEGPLFIICVVFWIYSLIRFVILSYVAVYMGSFEPRIIYSTYLGLTLLSMLLILDTKNIRNLYFKKQGINSNEQ